MLGIFSVSDGTGRTAEHDVRAALDYFFYGRYLMHTIWVFTYEIGGK
jgi:regulator of PEP synthase PpsR (kinase-PPPase family)